MRSVRIAFAVAAIATAQAGLAQLPAFTPAQRADGETKVQLAAKYMAGSLRDPSVAYFRNVFLLKRMTKVGEQVTVCGEVNGRNGYGGFTGFQRFIYAADRVYIGNAFGVPVDRMCGNANPIVDTRDYGPEMASAFKAIAGN